MSCEQSSNMECSPSSSSPSKADGSSGATGFGSLWLMFGPNNLCKGNQIWKGKCYVKDLFAFMVNDSHKDITSNIHSASLDFSIGINGCAKEDNFPLEDLHLILQGSKVLELKLYISFPERLSQYEKSMLDVCVMYNQFKVVSYACIDGRHQYSLQKDEQIDPESAMFKIQQGPRSKRWVYVGYRQRVEQQAFAKRQTPVDRKRGLESSNEVAEDHASKKIKKN